MSDQQRARDRWSRLRTEVALPSTQRTSVMLLRLSGLLVALLCAGNFLRVGAAVLADPYLLNYTEGINLHAAHQVLAGDSLYSDINRPPYQYFAYPPLYPYIAAAVVSLLGNHIFGLRLLCVACELGMAWLLYRMQVRRTGKRLLAGFFVALWLGVYSVFKFHAIARADHVEVLLIAIALDAFDAWILDRRRWRLWLFVVAFILACLTKQTAIIPLATLGAIALFWWQRSDDRAAPLLRAVLITVAAVLSVFLLLDRATDGMFLTNTVVYQALSGTEDAPLAFRQVGFILWTYGLIAIASLGVKRCWSWLHVVSAVALLWFYASSYKSGADMNYAMVSLFLTAITLGVAVATIPRSAFQCEAVAFAIAIASIVGHATTAPDVLRGCYLQRALATRDARAAVNRYVRDAPGPVISEEPFYSALNGKPVYLSDPFQLTVLAQRGKFDPRPLRAMIARGEFSAALIGPRTWALLGGEIDGAFRPVLRGGVSDEGDLWGVAEFIVKPGRSADSE